MWVDKPKLSYGGLLLCQLDGIADSYIGRLFDFLIALGRRSKQLW